MGDACADGGVTIRAYRHDLAGRDIARDKPPIRQAGLVAAQATHLGPGADLGELGSDQELTRARCRNLDGKHLDLLRP